MKLSIHAPKWATVAMTVGALTLLSACANDKGEVAVAPPPDDTSVASVQTFDIGTADTDQVGNALFRDGRVVIRGINFETDSAELLGAAYASTTRIGEIMAAFPDLKLAVVGHTDNTGDFNYNKSLSERRAQSIVDALNKDFDIEPSRLAAVGVGELTPMATNDTDFGRSENRRVELVVIDG